MSANWIIFPSTIIYWPLVGYCWVCSVVDQVPQVVGFVSLGYPFGAAPSIIFGRHHKSTLQCPKSKAVLQPFPSCKAKTSRCKNGTSCVLWMTFETFRCGMLGYKILVGEAD